MGSSRLLKNTNSWPVLEIEDIDMTLTGEKANVACHVASVVNEDFLRKFSTMR